MDLIAQQQQVAQVGEGLIVEIARDAPALAFGFVSEIQTRVGKFLFASTSAALVRAIRRLSMNGPKQSQQRQHQQDCQRG